MQQRQGYAVTKWLAEKVVLRASALGLHAATYRVDDVLPSAVTGFGNVRSLAHLMLKRCVALGIAPQGAGMLGLLTADGFGAWLAALVGRHADSPYSMHHVTGGSYVDFHDLVIRCAGQLGRPARSTTMDEVVHALAGTGDASDLLLAHMLRDRRGAVLFTPPDRLISTEQLPHRDLLAADAGNILKFIERAWARPDSR
jgi:thioester reductase-like protein